MGSLMTLLFGEDSDTLETNNIQTGEAKTKW